jgi:hypothetical protein
MSQGMTSFIFIFYSNSIAALILLPSSFFIHRFIYYAYDMLIISLELLLSVIWCRFVDMLGLIIAHQHLLQLCVILSLVLPSFLMFFLGIYTLTNTLFNNGFIFFFFGFKALSCYYCLS